MIRQEPFYKYTVYIQLTAGAKSFCGAVTSPLVMDQKPRLIIVVSEQLLFFESREMRRINIPRAGKETKNNKAETKELLEILSADQVVP